MSLVIIFNNKAPEAWAEILKTKLPDTSIEIYPNVSDKDKITFALCWKPDDHVLSQFPNLKVVQSAGASVEHIIKTQNLSKSIKITRIVDSQLSEDMFEFVLSGILMHLKNFPVLLQNSRQKTWQQLGYQTISNTVVGILGLGEIGAHVARRLFQLNFQVKGWSRSKKDLGNIPTFCGNEEFSSVLQANVLVNLLPLTAETENILNRQTLGQLHRGGYLINVGRGEHLVETDLIELLNNQHLSGALLDVFRQEPLPENHPFWSTEKITVTPHIAALTNFSTASDIVVENYRRSENNETLLHVVSVDRGY